MAANVNQVQIADERIEMGAKTWPVYSAAKLAAIIGLIAAVTLGYFAEPTHTFRRFFFGYLVAYAFFLSLALGALFFVLLQFLCRAGWSVSVRRVAESMAATIPVLAALSTPILVSIGMQNGELYPWAVKQYSTLGTQVEAKADHSAAAAGAEEEGEKPVQKAWLKPWFFIARIVVYLGVWSWMAMHFWRKSVLQDKTGDWKITEHLQKISAPCSVVLGLTLTLAAWDLFMSLDPRWYSTMFGVYYFSGCAVSFFAILIVICYFLQKAGFLQASISIEHYHDMGKFLFGFVFFWGYIAFSQYMLIWYSSIPEETEWFGRRGASTAHSHVSAWSAVIIAILFGQLLIPFGGLLSRHVKRNTGALVFWAVWLLVFHYVDMYWVILPEYGTFSPSWIDLAALLGMGGVMLATMIRLSAHHPLRPINDPRLNEAVTLVNV